MDRGAEATVERYLLSSERALAVFVAWRDLKFAKGRFALMASVIVLITVLVGLLSGLTGGLARENVSAITGLAADDLAFQSPEAGDDVSFTDSVVTADQWRQWAAVPGVERAEPLGITTTRAASMGKRSAVSVFGVRRGSTLAPGDADIGNADIVLTSAAADALAASEGDTVTVGDISLRVAAVSDDAHFSHTPVVWTSLRTWQALAPPDLEGRSTATVIALSTSSDTDVTSADASIGTATVPREKSLSAIGSYASENGSLQLMRGLLFAISALVVGAFFTVWTIQRGGDVAVLKALGATTASLLVDALGQALVLLVGGTLVGTLITVAVGGLADAADVPFVLSPGAMLAPAGITVLLGALGAALSIRRITSTDPLTALGSSQ